MSAEDGAHVRANRVGVWIAWACVVCAVVVVVFGLFVFLFAGSTCWGGRDRRSLTRSACQINLVHLAGMYAESSADPSWRPRSGQALVLRWRKEGRRIKRGQEYVLLCPADQDALPPDTPEAVDRYDTVDLDDPPNDLCSYAVRDFDRFPPDPARPGEEPFAACVGRFRDGTWRACHEGGLAVAYLDGHVLFLRWDELGFPPDAAPPDKPPVVGPDSPSPLLRVLCFRPGVTTR